jgi:hypothetical protein
MGIIEIEYTEIREITKKLAAGQIDKETAALLLKAYSESGKRVDQYIKVVTLAINHGNKAINRIVAKNIISDNMAIDVSGDIEDKLKCPEMGDRLITVDKCLDYSGETHHIDACQKCEHFSMARKRLFHK